MVTPARRRPRRLLGRGMVAGSALFSGMASADCSRLMPGPETASPRDISAEDIIQLREIGSPDAALNSGSPIAVAPDDSRIAFVISRADIATDSYCRGLVVVPLAGGKARLVDEGGEFISLASFVRGLRVEVGFPRLVTPAWSPDGKMIAILKREDGVTEAAVVAVDGARPAVVTRSAVDIEQLWWGSDGSLFAASRPATAAVERGVDAEGRSGWLYDVRMAPNYGPRPRVQLADVPTAVSRVNVNDGSQEPAPGIKVPDEAMAATSGGSSAGLEQAGASPYAPRRLWASPAGRPRVICRSPVCSGRFLGLWWNRTGKEIMFLRREGWNNELSAFYRWRPGPKAPSRTFATTDVIQNCVSAGGKLACTSESSTTPPRIILLDPASGARRTLFDPNPEFASLRLGSVRRLRVRNERGDEAWGDLVLPPGKSRGSKVPLILVQYNSRGFLRGGTGNEYPLFPLAARGFAVLSMERPPAVATGDPTLRTDVDLNAALIRGWSERKSLMSAIDKLIDAALATGEIDPRRIGITGLSDGATSAEFALVNSARFAAAAVSSCCLEPKTVMTYGGIAWAEFNRAIGYPPATIDAPAFWKPSSIAMNARTIRTPLLMQLSDDEYLLGLEAFEALREQGSPVEMYVFPGEHHIKWQPGHKLAVFERTADWFSFWLQCREDHAPSKAAQYARWRSMRPAAAVTSICPASVSTSSGPTPPRRPAS